MSRSFTIGNLLFDDHEIVLMGVGISDWSSETICIDLRHHDDSHISGYNLIGINDDGLNLCGNVRDSEPFISAIDLNSSRRLKVTEVDII